MKKKMYETPVIKVIAFDNGDTTNITVSSLQTGYNKTSYSSINTGNVIDF